MSVIPMDTSMHDAKSLSYGVPSRIGTTQQVKPAKRMIKQQPSGSVQGQHMSMIKQQTGANGQQMSQQDMIDMRSIKNDLKLIHEIKAKLEEQSNVNRKQPLKSTASPEKASNQQSTSGKKGPAS